MTFVGYKAEWCKYTLDFIFDARTSRGSMRSKDTYLLRITAPDGRRGIGEVPLFRGLSAEDTPEFETILSERCRNLAEAFDAPGASSIAFGLYSALETLGGETPSAWEQGQCGIPINGLIWMGDKQLMQARIREKLDAGFRVIKIKIGGINFEDELDLISNIRRHFDASDLELRLDANGSFTPDNALGYLDRLSKYGIHSIEQPIKAGQIDEMAALCSKSPIPIALDEELIGMRNFAEKKALLEAIQPHYIILKPALCGGFKDADEYISFVGPSRWWATSALESNVGLYAIASWLTRYHKIDMPQGLGTGMLYSNNFASPLSMHDARLWYDPAKKWQNLDSLAWRQ